MVNWMGVPRTHLDQQDYQAYCDLDRCGPHCTALYCQQRSVIGYAGACGSGLTSMLVNIGIQDVR